MAAWGYQFYLLVLIIIKVSLTRSLSLTRERYFQHEKIKLVSPCDHVISSICTALTDIEAFPIRRKCCWECLPVDYYSIVCRKQI